MDRCHDDWRPPLALFNLEFRNQCFQLRTHHIVCKNLRLLLQMKFTWNWFLYVHQKVSISIYISSWQHCRKWTHILHFSRHSNIHDVSFPPKHAMCSKVLLSKIMSTYIKVKNENRNKNSIRMIFIVTNTYLVYFLHWDPKIVFSALLLW